MEMGDSSLSDSFWQLINTDADAIEKDIEYEALKRANRSTSCSFLKKIQHEIRAEHHSKPRYTGRAVREGPKPRRSSTPIKKEKNLKTVRECSKNHKSKTKEQVTEMLDNSLHKQEIADDLLKIDRKNNPMKTVAFVDDHKDKTTESEMKENINPSQMSQEGPRVLEKPENDNSVNADAQSDHAKVKFRWKATKGLPGHILVVHLRVPFSQKLIALKWKKELQAFESEHHGVPCNSHQCTMIVAGRELNVEPLDIKFYTFESDVYLLDKEEARLYHERKALTEEALGNHKPAEPPVTDRLQKTTNRNTSSKQLQDKAHESSVLRDKLNPKELKAKLDNYKSKQVNSSLKRTASLDRNSKIVVVDESDGLDLPKYKIPAKFTKFSAVNKCNSMDSDGGESDVKMDAPSKQQSGIRRSRVYEKLLKEQLKVKAAKEESSKHENDREQRSQSSEKYEPRSSYRDESQYENSYKSTNGDTRRNEWTTRNGSEHEQDAFRLTRNGPSCNSEKEVNRFSDREFRSDRKHRSSDHINRPNERQTVGSDHTQTRYTADTEESRSKVRFGKESGYYSDTGGIRDRFSDNKFQYTREKDTPERYHSDCESSKYNLIPRRGEEEHQRNDEQSEGRFNEYERDRQPQIRAPLLTRRSTALTNKAIGGRDADNERSKDERMQDLEETVLSLKRVLNERERELNEYQAKTRSLETDLSRERSHSHENPTPVPRLETREETEKRINDLIREKENMATEIWQLKRDFDRVSQGQNGNKGESDVDAEPANHIDAYDPENPNILKRKIDGLKHVNKRTYYDDLESHLKDLQEVNETTANNLIRTEKELDQLRVENEALRKSRNRRMLELEDEVNSYREKGGEGRGVGRDSDYLRRETGQLRDDLRSLRDKNHQLVEDNIKLTEHLKDLEARGGRGGVYKGDGEDLRLRCDRYRKERQAALEEVDFLRKQLNQNRRDESMSRMRGKDYKSDTNLVKEDSYRDPSQRLSAYPSSSRPTVNGYSESQRRDRRNSGSDVSDSTAVLTSMPPSGYQSSARFGRDNIEGGSSKRNAGAGNSQQNEPPPLDRYDDVGCFKQRHSTVHTTHATFGEMIDDVIDELPVTSSTGNKEHYASQNIVEDEVDSDTDVVQDEHESPDNSISDKRKDKYDSIRMSNDERNKYPRLDSKHTTTHKPKTTLTTQNLITRSCVNGNHASKINRNNEKPSVISHKISKHLHNSTPMSFETSSLRPDPRAYDSFTCHSIAPSSISGTNNAQAPPTSVSFLSQTEVSTLNTSWCIDELSDVEDSISCVGMKNHPANNSQPTVVPTSHHFKTIHPPDYQTNTETNFGSPLKRSNSVGSDSTDLILGDAEQWVSHLGHPVKDSKYSSTSLSTHPVKEYSMSMHNLSTSGGDHHRSSAKSKDANRHHNVSLSANERVPSPPPSDVMSSTLRSISPRPSTTQHNKHLRSQSLEDTSFTANRRPFCPRSPADLNIGDIVKFSRQGGKISRGMVKYVGRLPGKNDTYLGVELEHEMGKHDGVYETTRYFSCKPNKGVFVAFSKVVMAWGN